jgi:hypothetical protein
MPKAAVDEYGDTLLRENEVRADLPPEGRTVRGDGLGGTRNRQLDDHMPPPSCHPSPAERRRELQFGTTVPSPADAGHDLRSDLARNGVYHRQATSCRSVYTVISRRVFDILRGKRDK